MGGARSRARVGVVGAVAATVLFSGLPAHAAPAGPAGTGPATATGIVQDIVVDNPSHDDGEEKTRKVLRVGDDIIRLADGSLPAAENGETVRARLAPARSGERAVLSATTVAEAQTGTGEVAGEVSSADSASATDVDPAGLAGVHSVYAVIVRPQGVAADAGLTNSAVTTAVGKAASYWASQTGSKMTFRLAGIAPSYVSAYRCGGGSELDMWEEALARISIPEIANQHLMIFAPRGARAAGCAYGLGSIGFWSGLPGLTFVSDFNQSVVAHELGHNLSLRHSNALRCPTAQDGTYSAATRTWSAGCASEEYGDLFDVMGYSGTGYGEGNLNPVHLTRMGLLPTAVTTVTTGRNYTVRIAPLSGSATALRAVRIVEASGQAYYVEYRTNTRAGGVLSNRDPRPD